MQYYIHKQNFSIDSFLYHSVRSLPQYQISFFSCIGYTDYLLLLSNQGIYRVIGWFVLEVPPNI